MVVTDRVAECRAFYTRWLGYEAVFEARPPGPEAFNGEGILVTLQVTDAAAEFERLQQAGLAIDHPLRDEPWGQRRFGLSDPAGVWVDVVEQIEPEPGYWDQYTPESA